MSSSYLLDVFVIESVEKGKRILDVGCGGGKWGYLLKISRKSPIYSVGIDVHGPNLQFVKEHKVYDEVIRSDARSLPFRDGWFQVVLAIEVLEHLEKSEGWEMLREIERVCSEEVILTTPNVYWHQRGRHHSMEHKCRWTAKELSRIGYNVRGVGFGGFGLSMRKLIFALAPLAYFLPCLSYILFCLKGKAD